MPNWTPLHTTTHHGKRNGPNDWDRACAPIFAALRRPPAPLGPALLPLPVPQGGCTFSFGAKKEALAAGAILRIWDLDPEASGPCLLCGGEGVATAFGGLLNVGGYQGRCLDCAYPLFKQLGGLGAMHLRLRPLLEGTPWYLNGTHFGAAVAGDGRALAAALGLVPPHGSGAGEGPSLTVGRTALVFRDVKVEEGE